MGTVGKHYCAVVCNMGWSGGISIWWLLSGNLFQNYFRPPLDPISIPTTLPNKATENKRERKETIEIYDQVPV